MSLVLKVSNISKSYNGKLVLKDCSYCFDMGGIYVLMGANGSGKSTFLRICALLEEPDRGEVNYLSRGKGSPKNPMIFGGNSSVIKKDINLRRRITLVLPGIGIFNTTVFNNVAYGLRIRGLKSREIRDRVDRVLDFVGLAHKRNQNALTLSSGEMQRLGIARAIVIEPEILFLDEPTASVDKENTEIIERIILDMKSVSPIIITTHDMTQAERLADSILTMSEGRITRA
ncbi:ABC transporter ATP-binding protein [Dissulfurispira thermophila]|uniref:ABC transporter ATP-binding protein n=2 Tax=root TaxID=1 RepID=A0A7G1H1S6_9BACT|nr:ATP-binding cassette domain-containing protein [Dissulfurispira thermophila]BCB96755.1 ABC transporter ATP-binding protein [Dissulfurispira thermophila]